MNSITTQVQAIKQGMQAIIHCGLPVTTTEQLANFYGCTKNNIKKNYSCNSSRFSEGKHYFVISGSVLRQLKNSVTFGNLVDKRAPKLTLWTERGAARHAKMLETDRAWDVYEQLEDYYFTQKEKTQTTEKKTTTDERTPLRDAVNMLVGKKGLRYDDAYNMVHQRFNIERIDELTLSQIPEAVEYIHRVVLEGEFISKDKHNAGILSGLEYPMNWWEKHEQLIKSYGGNNFSHTDACRFPLKMLYGFADERPSAIRDLIDELTRRGHDTSAVRLEFLASRHFIQAMNSKLSRIVDIFGGEDNQQTVTLRISPPMSRLQ